MKTYNIYKYSIICVLSCIMLWGIFIPVTIGTNLPFTAKQMTIIETETVQLKVSEISIFNNDIRTYNYADGWNEEIVSNVVITNIEAQYQSMNFTPNENRQDSILYHVTNNNEFGYKMWKIPILDKMQLDTVTLGFHFYCDGATMNKTNMYNTFSNIKFEIRQNVSLNNMGSIIYSLGSLYNLLEFNGISLIDVLNEEPFPFYEYQTYYFQCKINKTIDIGNYFFCFNTNQTLSFDTYIKAMSPLSSDITEEYTFTKNGIYNPLCTNLGSNFMTNFTYKYMDEMNASRINLEIDGINESNTITYTHNPIYNVSINSNVYINMKKDVTFIDNASFIVNNQYIEWMGELPLSEFTLGELIGFRNISLVFPSYIISNTIQYIKQYSSEASFITYFAKSNNYIYILNSNEIEDMNLLKDTSFNMNIVNTNGMTHYYCLIYHNNVLLSNDTYEYNSDVVVLTTDWNIGSYQCFIQSTSDVNAFSQLDFSIYIYTLYSNNIQLVDKLNRNLINTIVHVSNSSLLNSSIQVVTDNNGRFSLNDIPNGYYKFAWIQRNNLGNMIIVNKTMHINTTKIVSDYQHYFIVNFTVSIKDIHQDGFIGIVKLGTDEKTTNSDGKVTFEIIEGDYLLEIQYRNNIVYSKMVSVQLFESESIQCLTEANASIDQIPIYVWIGIIGILCIIVVSFYYYKIYLPNYKRIDQQLEDEIHDDAYFVHDMIHLFAILLIHKETGQTMFKKQWDVTFDADLISGFLSAMRSFESSLSSDTVSNDGLQHVVYPSVDINFINGNDSYLVFFSSKSILSKKAKISYQNIMSDIENELGIVIKGFKGSVDVYERIIPRIIDRYIPQKYKKSYSIAKNMTFDDKVAFTALQTYTDNMPRSLKVWYSLFYKEYQNDLYISMTLDKCIKDEIFLEN